MTLARRVLSGTGLLAASNGAVRLLSFVTMPVLTRLLAPDAYGEAALAGTVVSLASVLALAGVDTTYLRAYHSATPPSGPTAEQYCWRFGIATSAAAAVLAGLAWPALRPGPVEHEALLALLIGAGVLFSVLATLAQVRALVAERHAAMAAVIVATGGAAAAASIALAFWRGDVLALLVPLALAPALTVLLLGTPAP
ncbi:MAG TPA: oligosaccharide flippase family protein, partial [Casimicrobiaceae bacterium]|nr:oligosaccharide flippase family protein [Casimicrobiaceae bacterium]